VDHLKVDLLYRDDENGISLASPFVFRSKSEKSFFEFDYISKKEYTFQLTTVFKDGFSFTRDPQSSTQDLLVLPVSNP
jgi:hypothetical protein